MQQYLTAGDQFRQLIGQMAGNPQGRLMAALQKLHDPGALVDPRTKAQQDAVAFLTAETKMEEARRAFGQKQILDKARSDMAAALQQGPIKRGDLARFSVLVNQDDPENIAKTNAGLIPFIDNPTEAHVLPVIAAAHGKFAKPNEAATADGLIRATQYEVAKQQRDLATKRRIQEMAQAAAMARHRADIAAGDRRHSQTLAMKRQYNDRMLALKRRALDQQLQMKKGKAAVLDKAQAERLDGLFSLADITHDVMENESYKDGNGLGDKLNRGAKWLTSLGGLIENPGFYFSDGARAMENNGLKLLSAEEKAQPGVENARDSERIYKRMPKLSDTDQERIDKTRALVENFHNKVESLRATMSPAQWAAYGPKLRAEEARLAKKLQRNTEFWHNDWNFTDDLMDALR